MSEHDDAGTTHREGWFLSAAATVGDLGHPFNAEERQRDVWNEASAVGLQLMLLLGLVVAAAMTWLGGADGLPYTLGLLGVLGVGAGVSVLYAHRLGVQVDDPAGLVRLRLVPYAILLVLVVVGAARTAPDGGFSSGLAVGLVVGTIGALLALIGSGLLARRRLRRHSDEPA